MRNFNSCVYGPWRVRPVLRAHLDAGERVVAWGLTHRPATPSTNLLAIAVGLMPFVGPLLAPAVVRQNPRLVVLTDRRILFLRTDRKPANRKGRVDRTAVQLAAPLEEVLVRGSSGSWYEVRILREDKVLRVDVPDQKGRPAERLREALRLLAADELSAAVAAPESGAGERREPAGSAAGVSPWEGRIPE